MNTGGHNVAIDFELTSRSPVRASLHDQLDPTVFDDEDRVAWIRGELRAGNLVVISNAFDGDFAERAHACLEQSRSWRPVRRFDAREQLCREVMTGDDSAPELVWMHEAVSSGSTRRWVEDLSGCSCDGATELEAQRFLPGHYSNMDSGANGSRTVAILWHLSKDWDPTWGGDLVWNLSGAVIQPSFNTMYMFRVDPEQSPFTVSPVIPAARGRRLSIACWWSASEVRDIRRDERHAGGKTSVLPEIVDDEIFTLRSFHDVVD